MGDMMTPFMTIGIAYFVRNNIDAENPEQIFYVKCVYFLSLLVTWCLLAYMYFQSSRIGSSTERGKELKVKQMNTQTGKEEEVTMTQEAYDFSKIKGAFGQSFMGLCIMGFLQDDYRVPSFEMVAHRMMSKDVPSFVRVSVFRLTPGGA